MKIWEFQQSNYDVGDRVNVTMRGEVTEINDGVLMLKVDSDQTGHVERVYRFPWHRIASVARAPMLEPNHANAVVRVTTKDDLDRDVVAIWVSFGVGRNSNRWRQPGLSMYKPWAWVTSFGGKIEVLG